jgi:hypothetical protein
VSGEPVLPSGVPLAIEIDGILEGRIHTSEQILVLVRALDQCGIGSFQCDLNGGRFSLLPRETRIPGLAFSEAMQARFLDSLTNLIAIAVQGSVESTLRCRLVYAGQVAETLFVVRGSVLEPITRIRVRLPDEFAANPAGGSKPLPFGLLRRELFILSPVLGILGLLTAWRVGLIDQLLAARAEQIEVDTGPFGKVLEMRFVRSWGSYEVEILRGVDFPKSPSAQEPKPADERSVAVRAACEAAASGGYGFLLMRNSSGKTVIAVRFEMRPLLVDANAVVKQTLPGRMDAAKIALSLTAEEPAKK